MKNVNALTPFAPTSLALQWSDILQNMIAARGNQWGIVALVKAELTAYGLKHSDMSSDELGEAIKSAADYLTSIGFGPCQRDKDGKAILDKAGQRKPLAAPALSALRGDCKRSITGTNAKAKATAKKPEASQSDGAISAMVPRDRVDNSPVNDAPKGDGVAALAALGSGTATDKRYAHMLELAILTKDSKDANAKELSAMVREMLAALM